MTSPFLPRFLTLVLLALATTVPAQQTVEDDVLVDRDYAFRLENPGRGWNLLGETEIRALNPDAVAGALTTNQGGIVVAERYPQGDIDMFVDLIRAGMELPGLEMQSVEEVEFHGFDARRLSFRATPSGIPMTYRSTCYLKDGFAFQVTTWAGKGRSKLALRKFEEAFEPTDDVVRGRTQVTDTHDFNGVGWRVKEGVFQSAVMRFEVRPRGDWRVAIGEELLQMNVDAEVGLVHSAPDVYLVAIAEPAVGVDREAFQAEIEAGARLGMDVIDPVTHTLFGREVEIVRMTTSAAPGFEFLHAAMFVGDVFLQFEAWYIAQEDAGIPDALAHGFGAFQVLEGEALAGLERELREVPDPQNRIGPQFALRGGVYRDFEYGIEWTAPEGFWRIRAGDAATMDNPDAALILSDPARGIEGSMFLEPEFGYDNADFHQLILEMMFEPDADVFGRKPVEVDLGGVTALASEARIEEGSIVLAYHVLTVVHGDVAAQLLLYGLEGNLAAAGDAIAAAQRGLRFHALDPLAQAEGRFEDRRMGYALQMDPELWRRRDATPPTFRAIGSMHQWRRKEWGEVIVLAICPITEGQDEEWLMGFIQDLFEDSVEGEAKRSESTLADRPAQAITWMKANAEIHVHTIRRDSTFYSVIVDQRGGGEGEIPEILEGFELLR